MDYSKFFSAALNRLHDEAKGDQVYLGSRLPDVGLRQGGLARVSARGNVPNPLLAP